MSKKEMWKQYLSKASYADMVAFVQKELPDANIKLDKSNDLFLAPRTAAVNKIMAEMDKVHAEEVESMCIDNKPLQSIAKRMKKKADVQQQLAQNAESQPSSQEGENRVPTGQGQCNNPIKMLMGMQQWWLQAVYAESDGVVDDPVHVDVKMVRKQIISALQQDHPHKPFRSPRRIRKPRL